ncbi:hypothetical protein BK146_00795 [Paenibacillus sp. FSL R7-0333]|nr:hypothetical protein BK146_00795 [Paenibacillus sp. FSL R7-0333]
MMNRATSIGLIRMSAHAATGLGFFVDRVGEQEDSLLMRRCGAGERKLDVGEKANTMCAPR